MGQIAAAAGVAVQTLHFTFHTKADLLKEVVTNYAAGEEDPDPVMDRAWMREAMATPDGTHQLALHIEHGIDIYMRMAPLTPTLQTAASIDAEVAALMAYHAAGRRAGMGAAIEALARKGWLREGLDGRWTVRPPPRGQTEAVRRMKARAGRDITVGGPELAAQAIKAGLVDEYHLFVHAIVVGGGKRSLPDGVRVNLELVTSVVSAAAWFISTTAPETEARAQRNEMRGRRIKRYGVMALDALTDANHDRPFADLVTPLVPAAQRLAYGMLQNAQDSEDAVQEATFKGWRAFPRLREGSNHRAWFLTIVANECKQRRRNRWWSILKLAAPDRQDPAPQEMDGTSMDLRRAVARLPADMKLAIVLRYYLDLEFEDVGHVLGVSDKAAKARVRRALIRLRVDAGEMLNDA